MTIGRQQEPRHDFTEVYIGRPFRAIVPWRDVKVMGHDLLIGETWPAWGLSAATTMLQMGNIVVRMMVDVSVTQHPRTRCVAKEQGLALDWLERALVVTM